MCGFGNSLLRSKMQVVNFYAGRNLLLISGWMHGISLHCRVDGIGVCWLNHSRLAEGKHLRRMMDCQVSQ